MKTFEGTKIQRSHPLIDYNNQSMIYAHDGNRYTVGTPDSSGQIDWTCPHDGYLLCHIWGNNSGKLEIKDLTHNVLVMTLSQPTSNVGGPNRAWIPVYAGVQYRVFNSARTSQATFYPFATN
jgi:hypothetical protein